MNYCVTHQSKSLSPFDEALERQKQPLLLCTMDGDQTDLISRMTVDGYSTSIAQFVQYISSLKVLRKYRNYISLTHPSSKTSSRWSIQYREEDTYHDDEEEAMMMIETIDFVRDSAANEYTTFMMECASNVHKFDHSMYTTIDTNAMSSNATNCHPCMEQDLQNQQYRTQIIIIITTIAGIVAITTITVLFMVFIGTFVVS